MDKNIDSIEFKWRVNGQEFYEKFIPYGYKSVAEVFNYTYKGDSVGGVYGDYLISDYLMDLNSVYSIQSMANMKNKSHAHDIPINMLLDLNMKITIWLDVMKVNISYLLCDEPLNKFKPYEEGVIKIINLIYDFIDNYEHLNKTEKESTISEIEKTLSEKYSEPYENVINKILGLLRILSDSNHTANLNFSETRVDIEELLFSIPQNLKSGYGERFKRMKKIVSYSDLYSEYDMRTVLKISISHKHFYLERDDLLKLMVKKMQDIQHLSKTYSEFIIDSLNAQKHIRKLSDFFETRIILNKGRSNNDVSNKLLKKYSEGAGCFAILETDNINYFALSTERDYDGSSHRIIQKNSQLVTLAKEINKKIFNDAYVWARLTDKAKRYTETLVVNADNYDIKFIDEPIALGEETYIKNSNSIGLTYGCCERKIQAVCDDNTVDKKFYIRWAPCAKCIPSLINENGNLKLYASNENFNQWKNLGSRFGEYQIGYVLGVRKI